ncbi:hypothetical protein [Burkholderia ubonensis]|uniref:hypothetical protein n=1 Tax=Burkholderia ubonensis TaxID=101571 RepID=UPI0008FE1C25|nr:hypothetical protein [Burkholderia ubonensis]
MLPNQKLIESLDALDSYFKIATGPIVEGQIRGDPSLMCKYAALELCGWLEEAQDYLANECGRSLSEPEFVEAAKKMVGTTYGFDMKQHFLPMMSFSIGAANYESIVKALRVPGGKFSQMEGVINGNNYKGIRNKHAHTFFDPSNSDKLLNISSPAVVKQHAKIIYEGLEELYLALKAENHLT